MELYTIKVEGEDYRRDTIIDEYESLIWTERFIEPGDFRLVLPATYRNAVLMRPNSLLGVNTSRELMMVDTREILDGMITATGKTLEAFFANRTTTAELILDDPANAMRKIVANMQATPEAIPGLRTGLVAESFDSVFIQLKRDNVYEKLREQADKFQIGMAVYWVERTDKTHELVFSTRVGEDRSFDIMFSPDLDNLANVHELYSTADSASFVVVYPPEDISGSGQLMEGFPPAEIGNTSPFDTGPFDRRIVSMTLESIPEDEIEGELEGEKQSFVFNKMQTKAREELLSRKKKRVIDGEIVAETAQYKYYTQYNPEGDFTYRLGDSVRIGGNFTDPIVGTVTEYIQSADASGGRAYPSVVIPADPIQSGGDS